MAPIIGSWPVAGNRLDFVRPGTAAGQISLVSVVVGKVHTRLRDSPDGPGCPRDHSQDPQTLRTVGTPVGLRLTGNQDRRWPQ